MNTQRLQEDTAAWRLFVCLFVSLFAGCLFVCLFVCWLVCLFVCLFAGLLVCVSAGKYPERITSASIVTVDREYGSTA